MSKLRLVTEGATKQRRPLAETLDDLFSDWNTPGRPGGYVSILEGEKVVCMRAFGAPCMEIPSSWAPSTRFRIYAVTMTFVAIAMLIAEDRGLLSLDDDVRAHLPELPDYGTVVRLRNLLDHSSGLRDNEAVQFLAGFVRASPCSIEYALELIRRQDQLTFAPGSRIQFSNSNYRLLALVLERVTGTGLQECLQAFIFGPLGMHDTHVAPVDGPVIPDAALGYNIQPSGKFIHAATLAVTTGDGGIMSSIRDMTTWLAALRMDRLGVPNLLQRLMAARTLANGRTANYGLGIRLGEQNGFRFIGHGGEHDGYCCEFLHFIDTPLSVVVASNFFDANLEPLIHKVADAAMGRQQPSDRRADPNGSAMPLAGWYANTALPLVVSVSHAPTGEFGADLFVTASLGGLSDDGTGTYTYHSLDGYSSVSGRFIPQTGRRPMLELDFGDGIHLFEPVSEEYVSPAEMLDYVGLFGTSEINAVHRVYARDSRLFHLRGQGEWPMEQVRELKRVGEDLFVLDYRGGDFTTVRFRRNRRNRVVVMQIANRDVPQLSLARLPDPIGTAIAGAPARP